VNRASPDTELGPLVKAEGLGHVYRTAASQVVALHGLDLELGQGETVAVVGPSGSGKTTLIKILAAVEKPSHGRVEVGGQDLAGLGDRQREEYRRKVVGYLWQQSEAGLWGGLSAFENVQVPMLGERTSRRERRDRAAYLLELLRLGGRADQRPAQLDYGERQRLALAVAMVNRPRLLLCDEPTAELDSPTAQELLSDVSTVLRNLGVGAVIVTHDPQLERYVDRVIQIRQSSTSDLPFAAPATGGPSLRMLRHEAGRA
jgi:ABC-type lipoprotein export system ATPase subunit